MIILTPDQATHVEGDSSTTPGHALRPRAFVKSGASDPMLNGNYGLPEAVIVDPPHAEFSQYLAALPTFPDDQIQQGTPADPNNPGSPIIGSDWDMGAT